MWPFQQAYLQGNIASIGQIWQPPMEKDVLVENNVQLQRPPSFLAMQARHAVTEPQAQRLQ